MGIEHFEHCESRADYLRALIDLENVASPAEMMAAWQARDALHESIREPLAKTVTRMRAGSAEIRPFVRTGLGKNADLYRAAGDGGRKALLIGFCGKVNRMMIPVPIFLQYIPEDRFDVLILKDPADFAYLNGIAGLGSDLAEVVASIRRMVPLSDYRDVRCIGTSAGGSPALHAGILLGASRAMSIGGRYRGLLDSPDDVAAGIRRYDVKNFHYLVAGHIERSTTALLLVYGADYEQDIKGSQGIRQRLPKAQTVVIQGLDHHNVVAFLALHGQLSAFLERFLFCDLAE